MNIINLLVTSLYKHHHGSAEPLREDQILCMMSLLLVHSLLVQVALWLWKAAWWQDDRNKEIQKKCVKISKLILSFVDKLFGEPVFQIASVTFAHNIELVHSVSTQIKTKQNKYFSQKN